MASAQRDPVRGSVRDQKDDSLLAIKDWLIRNPRVARPEPYSAPPNLAASERGITQEEVDDAPSIAAASQFPVDLVVDECANHAAAHRLNDPKVVQGDGIREGKLAVRTPLRRVLACAVLLLAVVIVALTIFLSGRQSDIFGAWSRLKEWLSYESHMVLPASDAGTVSERSEANMQSSDPSATRGVAQSSPADAGPSEVQHQSDAMLEDLGPVQRTIHDSWNRSKEWFAYASQAVFSKKSAGTVPERSEVTAQIAAPSATSPDASTITATQLAPASIRSASSEMQHQLDAISEDLDDLRRIVADLAIRQEQTIKDVATLQSAQQSMSQRLSTLPRSTIFGTSRKNLHHRLY